MTHDVFISYSTHGKDKVTADAICAKLGIFPEVHLIMTLMSGFEILVGIHLQNPEKLYKFIVEVIARIDGVSNIETLICAEIRKRSYPLFELDGES